MNQEGSHISIKNIFIQTIVLAFIWYLLAGQSLGSWLVGIPAIILSLVVSHFLPSLPVFHFDIYRSIPFVGYFVQQSLIGGVDVALRAFHPKCPLQPALIKYKLNLSNAFARVVFTNSISLLPGTLSVRLGKEDILVHVLDDRYPNHENLLILERKIAAMFREDF